MLRCCSLLSVCLLALAPVAASAKPKQSPAPSRPYIETSYVIAPKTVGAFTLTRSKYDPAAKLAGAGFHYAMDDHPELAIDVFVYPIGRQDPARALDDGLVAFRRDLSSAVTHGTYSRLDELDHAPFALGGDTSPPSQRANDMDAAVLAAIAESERTAGERLRLSMQLSSTGMPLFSNGYLFYKQLYYFKVRVSAARDGMTQEGFDALADRTARTLVPAIEVANVGGCAGATIHIDVNDPPEQRVAALVRQARTQMGFNCHGSAKDAGIDGHAGTAEVIEIAYAAGDWTSR
ncbi:hypothetical protein [Xanthomonas bundabergensis]|uniref:hypothetical protein n=1 Tax=Xanthomonas bundabergensis TaxID=3160842 RepID=UPI00351716DB